MCMSMCVSEWVCVCAGTKHKPFFLLCVIFRKIWMPLFYLVWGQIFTPRLWVSKAYGLAVHPGIQGPPSPSPSCLVSLILYFFHPAMHLSSFYTIFSGCSVFKPWIRRFLPQICCHIYWVKLLQRVSVSSFTWTTQPHIFLFWFQRRKTHF